MPVFSTVNEFLNRQDVVFRVRVEILKDDGTTWLDVTDMVNYDRLSSLPGLTNRQERSVGAAEVSLSSLKMDNSDRFWDRVPPAGITSWFRKRLRVSLVTQAGVTQLGVWVIEDIDTAGDDLTATLTLVTLSKRLFDKEADRVKNGRDWYTNRPIGWLVRELLAQEFTRAEVQSWPNVLTRYQVPLADPSLRAVSSYGRPPEFDGTTWREDSTTLYGSPYVCVNAASNANYGKHWMGIGGELWRWDPDTDTWTKWCGMPAGRTNFKIFHLYVNATRNKVIAVAWEIDAPPGTYPATTGDRSGAKNGDVAILFADMTTPPSVLQEFAGKPGNIYTGHYAVRCGRSSGGTTNIGAPGSAQLDANCAGINIPVPAGHYTRATWLTAWAASTPPHTKKKTTFNGKPDSAEQGGDITANGSWRIDVPGYYAPFNPIASDPMDFRWSMGQFRGAFAHQVSGDEFVCTVISWDGAGATYRFRIWKLNTNTGIWTDTTEYVMVGNENLAPFSFQFRSDDVRLLCASARFRETAWSAGAPVVAPNEPYSSAVVEFTWPLVDSGAPVGRPNAASLVDLNTNHVVSANPERYWALWFDAVYGASDYVLLTGIDVRGMLSSNAFVATTKRISTGNFGPYLYSSNRISGAVYEAASGQFFVHDAGANQVRKVPANDVNLATAFWTFEDSGFPPVSGDTALLMGLVLDLKRSAVFGVSGPGGGAQANAEVMGDAPLSGKYYLWQLASWLTDRVEIADFSGNGEHGAMTVKECLEELAAIMDAVYGFDRQAAFYFKARPRPTTMVATLTANSRADTKRVPDVMVRKRTGSQRVFNVAEMTPATAVLKPPSGSVRVLARPVSFARPPWNAAPEVFQGNNRNLNVFMRCVQGGLAGSEDDGCVRKTTSGKTMVDYAPGGTERIHKLRFAFLIYDTVVETQLLADVAPAADTILIPIQSARDVRGVESGILNTEAYAQTDEVLIGDTERYTVRTKTDDIVNGRSTLRLDRAVVTAWKTGTKLTIRTRGNNRWSDHADGITYFSTILGAPAAGTVETLDVFSTRDLCPGMVLRIDTSSTAPSASNTEEMRVVQILSATQVQVIRGVGGTTPSNHTTIRPVRAYWAPLVSPQFPEGTRFNIGGTGVSLRFADLPDTGEPPFMVGDSIEIVCPGLSLERQDKAKIISYNVPSIEKFGKLPWANSRQSRFAGYRQCIESCKRIVNDFGQPHFDLTVDMPLRWLPDINEGYLVEDLNGVLPRATSSTSPNGDSPAVSPDTLNAVAAVVEGYTLDILGDRVTLNARALNPHP